LRTNNSDSKYHFKQGKISFSLELIDICSLSFGANLLLTIDIGNLFINCSLIFGTYLKFDPCHLGFNLLQFKGIMQ
jgi:hypothetical protein